MSNQRTLVDLKYKQIPCCRASDQFTEDVKMWYSSTWLFWNVKRSLKFTLIFLIMVLTFHFGDSINTKSRQWRQQLWRHFIPSSLHVPLDSLGQSSLLSGWHRTNSLLTPSQQLAWHSPSFGLYFKVTPFTRHNMISCCFGDVVLPCSRYSFAFVWRLWTVLNDLIARQYSETTRSRRTLDWR